MQCNCLKYNYLIFRTPLKIVATRRKRFWLQIVQSNSIGIVIMESHIVIMQLVQVE